MAFLTVTQIAERAAQLFTDQATANGYPTGVKLDSAAAALHVPYAMSKLSFYRAISSYVELTGDGEAYDFTLAGWVETNRPTRVEYPTTAGEQANLTVDTWSVQQSPSGGSLIWILRLVQLIPDGETFYLYYTAHHSGTTTTTVEDTPQLKEAVSRFCAAELCREWIRDRGQKEQAGIPTGAEIIDLTQAPQLLKDMADELDRSALEVLGVVSDDAAQAGGGGTEPAPGLSIQYVTQEWPDGL